MDISNSFLKNLYKRESGKLLLDFSDSKRAKYINIIMNTKPYMNIIESIPNDLSNIEKAYYIYTRLGILLYENNSLVYNHINNLGMYYGTIRTNGIGNCRQMSELFVTMLLLSNIIEKFYLTRKPVGVEQLDLRHIDAIIQVDGKLYMTDIIRDTVNLRAGIRCTKFGFVDTKEKRALELKQYILSNKYISDIQKAKLIKIIDNENFEELLTFVKNFKQKTGLDIGLMYLERKIPKFKYVTQIQSEIGNLTEIPQKSNGEVLSIENLDKRINNVRRYGNIGFPFNFFLDKYNYFEDIIKEELIPKLSSQDSYIRKGFCFNKGKTLPHSLDESVELDIDIILNFFYKIAPDIDPEICLKYLKLTLEKIYNSRKDYNFIVNKDWLEKNIKLYQTIGENDIRKNNESFPLQTILVIRRFHFSKEKYLFYEMQSGSEPKKISYEEMLKNMRQNGTKICSKFSSKRTNAVEELEL